MVESVHLILGKEAFLAERARDAIIAEVKGATHTGRDTIADVPVTTMRAGEVDPGELAELLSPSLFGEDRVIVLTDADAAGKEAAKLVLEAATSLAPGITLIVIHSGGGRAKSLATQLRKKATVHEAHEVSARERGNWVRQEFARHRVRATPDVIRAVLESVGSDLRELATAISQLVADTGGEVTVEKVHEYYVGVAEVSGFDIADLAVAGQVTQAVATTRRALQLGVSPVALTAALASKVGAIARLYSSRGRGDTSVLKMPPFAVDKAVRVARSWSGEAVSEAVILIADLDAAVKGQGGDPEYAIEDAVRRLAELARA